MAATGLAGQSQARQQLWNACRSRTSPPRRGDRSSRPEVRTLLCWDGTRDGLTFTMGTYSSGGAGWILLDISMTAFTRPVTCSYTLSLERSRLAVGGGLISWG